MATSFLSLMLACLLFYTLVSRQFEENYRRDLHNIAEIAGKNCKAALLFDVADDAEMILASMGGKKSIQNIHLYDGSGRLFASYPANSSLNVVQPKMMHEVNDLSDRYLLIEDPIALENGTVVGSIVLLDDRREMIRSKKIVVSILLSVGAVVLAATFLLARFLGQALSDPLERLTEMATEMGRGNFESVRSISVQRQDEIGMLTQAFVEMSEKLQRSRMSMEKINLSLEDRVRQRTEELQKALIDLKQSQVQLVQSEKMAALGQLVAGVAHEINNNINFIASAIPSLGEMVHQLNASCGKASPGDAIEGPAFDIVQSIHLLLANAEEGVVRTKKIISDLNSFARPTGGKCLAVDIHEELNRTLTLLKYELGQNILVKKHYAKNLPPVDCLCDQLNQVFMNILLNAVQVLEGQGVITITTSAHGDKVHISFADSGSGIDPEMQQRIFDPFFTTKEVGKGTGLGLSIAYSIIKNHGGEIRVESKKHMGTTMVVEMPIHGLAAPMEHIVETNGDRTLPARSDQKL